MGKKLGIADHGLDMQEEEKYYLMMCNFIGYKSPAQWISRLFDLQNALIGYGFMSFLEDESAKELAKDFEVIKDFLENLKEYKNILS